MRPISSAQISVYKNFVAVAFCDNGLMIDIIVNDKSQQIAQDSKISDLITMLSLQQRRIAVEINEEIIPRSQYQQHVLNTGDRIEIIHAIGGG